MIRFLLALISLQDETYGVDVQITGMKSAAAANDIADALSKITGVAKAEAKFDEAMISVRFSSGVSFKPREFESAIGAKGKLKEIRFNQIQGKVSKKGNALLFRSNAGVEYIVEQTDSGGVMGVEEQLPFIEKKVAEGKPGFLLTGRLKVERTADKKTKKETETYRIDIRKATWVSDD